MVSNSRLSQNVRELQEGIEELAFRLEGARNERYIRLREISDNAPSDPQLFYQDVGLFIHPRTQEPVKELTVYQREFNEDIDRYKYAEAIKSNKIGLSSSVLVNLFYHMITDCAGYQALILAQNSRMSREHLYTLQKYIVQSVKYSDYLISIGDRDMNVLRGEQTRITEMFIRNPYNPKKPTRVISIPATAGSAVSWKEVKYVMCSDITMTDKDYDPVLKSAFTRLAQTRGYFVIETIPRGPQGLVYDIWLRNRTQQGTDFKVREYPVLMAVQAGLIQEDFLEQERQRHGPDFARLYECSFAATGGNLFALSDIDDCINFADYEPDSPEFVNNLNYPKAMGVDPGHRTSKAGIVILQMRGGNIEVLDAKQLAGESNSAVIDYCFNSMLRWSVENIFVDASASPFISDFKRKINEVNYVIMKDIMNNPLNQERVVPVTFHPMNKPMIIHANQIVSDKYLRIDKRFQDLINQMKIAQHADGKLVKNKDGNTMDLLDALLLALLRYDFILEMQK
jgi:hypothetical protein